MIILNFINKKLHKRSKNESGKFFYLNKGNKNSFETLPIRAYLDDTVIPLVLKALSALAQ